MATTSERILNPPSDAPGDATAYAVQAIREATTLIAYHYHEQGEWPGWDSDAVWTARFASDLLSMGVPRATADAEGADLRPWDTTP